MATVGKAIGQVVRQLLSHCAGSSEWIPCVVTRTKAETMQTMMAESSALKRIGEKRLGAHSKKAPSKKPGRKHIMTSK